MFFNPFKDQEIEGFYFGDNAYELTDEIIQSYKDLKVLFLRTTEIFLNFDIEPMKAPSAMKQLFEFYKRADQLTYCLLSELFYSRWFAVELKKGRRMFELLEKLLKMFMIVDLLRIKHINVFQSFAELKCFHAQDCERMMTKNQVFKYSVFVSLSMPMSHLFLSYFSSDEVEIYFPVILSKRATIYLSQDKKKLIRRICCILRKYRRFKYSAVFFVALHESFCKSREFEDVIQGLDPQKQAYFSSIVKTK